MKGLLQMERIIQVNMGNMKRSLLYVGLVLIVVMLSGCGRKQLSGTYESEFGIAKYTFHSNGKCEMSDTDKSADDQLGVPQTLELNYEIVDGHTIKFTDPNETPPRNRMEKDLAKMFAFDGALSSDWNSFTQFNMTYTKQADGEAKQKSDRSALPEAIGGLRRADPATNATFTLSVQERDYGKTPFNQVIPHRRTVYLTDALGTRPFYSFKFRSSIDGKIHTCLLQAAWGRERMRLDEWQYLFEDFEVMTETPVRQASPVGRNIPNKQQLEALINQERLNALIAYEKTATEKQRMYDPRNGDYRANRTASGIPVRWNATEINGYMHMPIVQGAHNFVRVQSRLGGDLTYMCDYRNGRWSIRMAPEILAVSASLWDGGTTVASGNDGTQSYPSPPTSGRMYNSAEDYITPEGYTGEIQQGPAPRPDDFSGMTGDWAKRKIQ